MTTQQATPKAQSTKASAKLPAEVLTKDEVLALLAACSRRGPTGIRNKALLAMLWRCGLRISEALALTPANVDPKAGTVRILRGKGAKARTVGIDPQTLDTLAAWVAERKDLGIGAARPLFCQISKGSEGEPIDSSYVRHMLPRLAKKAGVTKRVHAHAFRHTHAVELLREGANVGQIQGALGHSSIAVTNTYLAHLNPAEVIQVQRNREW